MSLSRRQKWSLGLIALMALSVPTYYLFREKKVDSLLIPVGGAQWLNAARINIIETDILYLDIVSDTAVEYEIREYHRNIETGLEGTQILTGNLNAGETLSLDIEVRAVYHYNVVLYISSETQAHVNYYLRTDHRGFLIWMIFLGVILVAVWVGSFLMTLKIPKDPQQL